MQNNNVPKINELINGNTIEEIENRANILKKSTNVNSKRIAKNTLMLYTRQILILLVSLFTVRVVLNILGVEDYGIYNVIGGIVSFLTFISGTMASATQRFFSFALGQNNLEKLKKTFIVNLIIYSVIAIIALILLETIGLWFVNEQLRVPHERFESARLVYQFSALTFISTIFTTPFMAIIIAHEDMQIYAYVSIFEAIMKLGIAYLLIYLPWDKLELYGILVFTVSIITAIIYISTCTKKYIECQFRDFCWDKKLFYEILGFTGWTLFGQITTAFRNQAITILLNQVFSPIVVAARAVSSNITSRINDFSNNFNLGLYPSIIKSFAADDKKNMFSLIFNGSKITFFLLWVFTLPLFLEMDTILQIWLKNPPPEAILFTRLALVEVLINSISLPITTAARAPGRMKVYELSLGSIQLAIFVASWMVLEMGAAAYSVYIVAIVANIVMFIVRLIIVRSLINISIALFFQNVVFPVTVIILSSSIPSFALHLYLPNGLIYSSLILFSCMIFASVSMYFIGLDKIWRQKVRNIVVNKIHKVILLMQ